VKGLRKLEWRQEQDELVPYIDGSSVEAEHLDEVLAEHDIVYDVGARWRSFGCKVCTRCRLVYAERCSLCGVEYVRCVSCGAKLRERSRRSKLRNYIDVELGDGE